MLQGRQMDMPAHLVLWACDLAPLAQFCPVPQSSCGVWLYPLAFPSSGSHQAYLWNIPRLLIQDAGRGGTLCSPLLDADSLLFLSFQEDKGGTGSLSASKWTTFLKASLICVDPVTKGNFNWLQDVFFVPASNWRHSKVYGLFTNTW